MDRSLRFAQLADSYLEHIRIAVEADDRGAPFRDFIDNWAAFSADADHHRSRGGRVVWFNNPDAIARRTMLLSLPFRSAGAEAILQLALERAGKYRELRTSKHQSVKLVVDHTVPLAVIVEKLFKERTGRCRERISEHLTRFYSLGLLTGAEDAKLSSLGLRSSMPDNWDGNEQTALYRAAGIFCSDPATAPYLRLGP